MAFFKTIRNTYTCIAFQYDLGYKCYKTRFNSSVILHGIIIKYKTYEYYRSKSRTRNIRNAKNWR